MANIYSLVCFGGLSGKTVTFTDAGDVVNLTNHGLRQGVTGIVFSTTGTLPTGIVAGTTYYPRDGADANKFTIHPTKVDALAGTNQVTFTGTGSGTHTVKSAYMLGLTSEQLARYGSPGSERIYEGLSPLFLARKTETNMETDEVWLIGDAFTETVSTSAGKVDTTFSNLPAASLLITTLIDNVRSEAFHQGRLHQGYIYKYTPSYAGTGLSLGSMNQAIDGIGIWNSGSESQCVGLAGIGASISNCVVIHSGFSGNGTFIAFSRQACVAYNNVCVRTGSNTTLTGISFAGYGGANGARCFCNLVVNCNIGYQGASSPPTGLFFANNLAINCTTSFREENIPDFDYAGKNGANSGTPWGIDALTVATTDFVDFSSNDFRPALPTSPQVDSGLNLERFFANDIKGDPRPSYDPGGPMKYDVGPYEYDHGYGLAPASVAIDITGMIEGSVLAIYRTSDHAEIVAPTTIGASGSYSTTYSWTGNVSITVVVRKATGGTKYLPYSTPGLITAGGFGLVVSQVEDLVLNG